MNAEQRRLAEDARREKNWKRWGPYLAERQRGTVREDYSADGDPWTSFPHGHARSRAYRWSEDGLLGITDRECRLGFALALWNGRDPILKERLFGLTGPQSNHDEDVKELYFYLDSTPTHSYMKALYKYPQAPFPYDRLVAENARRGHGDPEFELIDTGVFDEGRYFDVFAEYAKRSPNDILIRLTLANRGQEPARLHVLPTLWFRNTWIWGCRHGGCTRKPHMSRDAEGRIRTDHETLGAFPLAVDGAHTHRLLAIPSLERLERVLAILLDEDEFLSPYGIRSLSRVHAEHPYTFRVDGAEYRVAYEPGESESGLFGGNSNWRGPVWFPVNVLLIEALERYHHFYGDTLQVDFPTGSGNKRTLQQVADELSARLAGLFLPDERGHRPCHGGAVQVQGRPALAGPRALPRVLPRGDRPRPRRQPPDRLDRPGDAVPGNV